MDFFIDVWEDFCFAIQTKADSRTVFVLTLILFLILICLIPKVIVWVISRKLEKAYRISLKISNVGFFIGHNIRLEFSNNLVLEINYAQLKNLLFLRSMGRLCSLHIGDVRLHCSYASIRRIAGTLGPREEPRNGAKRKDDGFLLTAFQFIIVHINKVAVVISELPGCDCLLTTTLRNIRLHPTFDAAQLRFNAEIESTGFKILSTRPESVLCGPGGTLLNFSMACNADLALHRTSPSKVRQVGVHMVHPRLFLTEDILPELASLSRLSMALRAEAAFLRPPPPPPPSQPQPLPPSRQLPWQRLPNGLSVTVDRMECEIVRLALTKSLKVIWEKFTVEMTRSEEQANVLSMLATLKEFDTQSDLTQFARVEKFQVNCQITSTVLNTHIKLEHPLFVYNREELNFWSKLIDRFLAVIGAERSRRDVVLMTSSTLSSRDALVAGGSHLDRQQQSSSWLGRLSRDRRLCLKVEVNPALRAWHGNPDGQLVVRWVASDTKPGLEIGLKALHLTFETEPRAAGDSDSPLSSSDLYWEINTMYCKLMESETDISDYHDRVHYWQTVLYLGNIFMWSHKLRLGGMLSHVQLEWSKSLADRLCDLLEAYHPTQAAPSPAMPGQAAAAVAVGKATGVGWRRLLRGCEFDVKVNHLNAYLLSERGVFVLHRVDLMHLQSSSEKKNALVVKGTVVAYVQQADKEHPVVSSDEVTNCVVGVKEILANQEQKNFSVQFSDPVAIQWRPALHLCLTECVRATQPVIDSFQAIRRPPSDVGASGSNREEEGESEGGGGGGGGDAEASGFWSYRFSVRFAQLEFLAELLDNHRIAFVLGELRGRWNGTRIQWISPQVAIRMDEHNIFVFNNADLRSNHHAEETKKERSNFSVLETESNRAWEFICDEWLITFPYKYNFYACFDASISIRKFLRKLHASGKDPFRSDRPLAADYIIRAKEFVFQVNDDPFEVKLGDNYALLSDEMVQREIRYEKLCNQLNQKDSTRFYSDHTRDQVHRQLEHMHTQVYVDRHGKLYERHPRREALFTWSIRDMKLFSFADRALHGRANVIAQLKAIDAASPYPPEGLDFTTLWCRFVSLNFTRWTFQMRDYPNPMWDIEDVHLWGRLAAAENIPAPRAMRHVTVDPGAPWSSWEVIRCMPPLKFYHDFTADVQHMMQCYGPCWEPCFAWINLSMDLINRPSRDPSPPMPWWDKFRLKLHGNLVFHAERMSWVYPTSLDPYNETEFMDWTWQNVLVEWTNMKWVIYGDLDILCRTASKYDDCRLFHMPKLELIILLNWISDGDPNNHHAVMPCAPDEVPDSRVPYDSFRMFRTRRIDMTMSFTIRPSSSGARNLPECLFYTNILKFFDKFKMCLAKVSRPIRRGKLFECIKPRKPVFSRLFRNLRIKLDVPSVDLCYWVSFARKQGLKMATGPVSLDVTLHLDLKPFTNGLHRRARADWSVAYMRASTSDIRMFLTAASGDLAATTATASSSGGRSPALPTSSDQAPLVPPPSIHLLEFLQLSVVSYERNEPVVSLAASPSSSRSHAVPNSQEGSEVGGAEGCGGAAAEMTDSGPPPVHRVEVRDLKIRWTSDNRTLVFRLIDNYRSRKSLKKNLAAQALRAFKVDSAAENGGGGRVGEGEGRGESALDTASNALDTHGVLSAELETSKSPRTKSMSAASLLNSTGALLDESGVASSSCGLLGDDSVVTEGGMVNLLEQLVKEVDSGKFIVDCEKTPKPKNILDQLHGYALCKVGDVLQRNWHVDFSNSQVMLKSSDLSGYMIVSAAHAHLDSLDNRPVWKGTQLLTKSTLVGRFERMQYYATVDQVDVGADDVWLNENDVMCPVEEDEDELSGRPEIVGCSRVVGGVVTACAPPGHQVGKGSSRGGAGNPIQLQRIISRCQCEVFYVSYDPADANLVPQEIIPPLPSDDKELFKSSEEGVDILTLLHHNLNVCTNTLQYHMIVDLVNDLLLYVEPQRKAALERLKIQLSLLPEDNQKTLILKDQEELRVLSRRQRELERSLYVSHRRPDHDPGLLVGDVSHIERAIAVVKERIQERNLQLTQRISYYQQCQVQKQRKAARARSPGQEGTVAKRAPGTGQASRSGSGISAGHSHSLGGFEASDGAAMIRRNEVCFEHARWRLTENDGQIGIADLQLRGFLHTKVSRDDDSGAHHFELGWFKVENLLPNSFYREVLIPNADLFPSDSVALRIKLIEKAPVGGIPIKEHLEVNIVPLDVQLTKQFYRSMMHFFFPGRAANGASGQNAAPNGADLDGAESTTESLALPASSGLSVASAPSLAVPSSAAAPAPTTPSLRSRALHRKKRSADSEEEWSGQTTAPHLQVVAATEPDGATGGSERKDDVVEMMRERARNNNVFLYIKIPEIPIRFSYKGEKTKNMIDVRDFHLTVPVIEYHNETWTWLDLALAVKSVYRRHLLAQAIRQKLKLRRFFRSEVTSPSNPNEEEEQMHKLKVIFGTKLARQTYGLKKKRSLFRRNSKS